MAVIIPTLGIVKGSIGGISFNRSPNGNIVKSKAPRRNVSQHSKVKGILPMLLIAKSWRFLSAAHRNGWRSVADGYSYVNRFGRSYNVSGYQLFQALNFNRSLVGGGMFTAPPPLVVPSSVVALNWSVSSARLQLYQTGVLDYANEAVILYASRPTPFVQAGSFYSNNVIGYIGAASSGTYDLTSAYEEAWGLSWSTIWARRSCSLYLTASLVRRASGVILPLPAVSLPLTSL